MSSTLADLLAPLNVDRIKPLFKPLGLKPVATRKADIIDELSRHIRTPAILRKLIDTLPPHGLQALGEALYGTLSPLTDPQFRLKYGADLPLIVKQEGSKPGGYGATWNPTSLAVLLHSERTKESEGYTVPREVRSALEALVPEPPEVPLASTAAPVTRGIPHTIRETAAEALIELAAYLRAADQGLKVGETTGVPAAATEQVLANLWVNGDYYPPSPSSTTTAPRFSRDQEIGAIKSVGWTRLLKVGGYISLSGGKTKVTKAGLNALSLPSHVALKHLWDKWLGNSEFDEFNRVDAIKGQMVKRHMTAKPPRRAAVAEALELCPVDQWVTLKELSRQMRLEGITFEVSNDDWKLYLCEPQYGSLGYAGYDRWETQQLRYMLAVFVEYAAPLGLIDLNLVDPEQSLYTTYEKLWGADGLRWLSRYDGLDAIRLTPLGAYCLGLTTEYYPPIRQDSAISLIVQPSGVISIKNGTPTSADLLLLDTWATAEEPGRSWRLTPQKASEAVTRGRSATDFVSFLQTHDTQPLPSTVLHLIHRSESDATALQRAGTAEIYHCRDAMTVEDILGQKALKGQCQRFGESGIVVPSDQVPKFKKLVENLGLGIV